jgi:phosphatidylglycerol lysyltransferase
MERVSRYLGPAFVLAVFGCVVWLLHRELAAYHWHDIVAGVRGMPTWRIAVAIGLTILSYLVLVGYDFIALRELGKTIPLSRIALASFCGFVTGYNFGATLGGSSVRYRLYSAWGLSAVDIFQLMALLAVTFWMGLAMLGGMLLTFDSLPLPPDLHLPITSARPIGFLLLASAVALLIASAVMRKPLSFRGWSLKLPSVKILLVQTAIGIVDLTIAASVLYVLLPNSVSISFEHFLAAYLLGVSIALVSHVPGGLGVLEFVLLAVLNPEHPPDLLASLLVFRVVYFLLPLGVCILTMAAHEAYAHRRRVKQVADVVSRTVKAIAPRLFAWLAMLTGAILLFSGATPTAAERLPLLKHVLPLEVMEASHFLASLVGMALLIIAQGLRRRLDAAYWMMIGLLIAGVVLSLLKGFDVEEAGALLLVLLALAPLREHFYRRGRLIDQPLTPAWLAAVLLIIICSVGLGMFAYKRVEFTSDLWWQFSLHGDAPRFLRATVGVLSLGLVAALIMLLHPSRQRPHRPTDEELTTAAAIAATSPETSAHLALLGDKSLLFNDDKTGFVMYGISGQSWVALGDPVAPDDERAELAWRFRELVDEHQGWPVFYQANQETLPIYLDLGLSLLKLGEEARVPLADFSLAGNRRKSLRTTFNRVEREGLTFEVCPSAAPLLPQLKRVSDAWLSAKNTREKRFSLGFFNEDYLARYPVAVIRRGDEVLAFANVLPGAEHEELSVDLMRYTNAAPAGVMDQLFAGLMLWGKEQGYAYFNLGVAPLSGLENRQLAPLWHRIGGLLFRHGEHFYNFEGLRDYKEKFDPQWRPKYLASPGGFALPVILANVATLISGGVKGLVAK